MKRLFLALILFTLISTSHAQFIRGYGIKVGTTISNQDWQYSFSSGLSDLSFEPDNRVGLNIGVFLELLNVPLISIVTEVNYDQKGMKQEILVVTEPPPNVTGEYITWGTRVDYISIAALGKVRFSIGIFTPYILLGPKIDFEINIVNSFGAVNEVEENFNKNIFGFKVGVGTEINLLSINLLAEILYDADFNELYENQNLKVDSNSLELRIGLML